MGNIKVNVVRKFKSDIEVKEHENFGIISIRHKIKGSLSKKKLTDIIGSKLPKTNEILFLKKGFLAWMSNDEMWFIFSKSVPKTTTNVLTNEIQILNGLTVDISDSRIVFSLRGVLWRNVLAKGSPANLSENSLKSGIIRRTRLGLVPVAIWCQDKENAFVICNRSVRDYVFNWLETASLRGSVPAFH